MNKYEETIDYTNKYPIKSVIDQQKIMIEKYGYYFHLVFNDNNDLIDAHTHNVKESINCNDFQVVLPLESTQISLLFKSIYDDIKNSKVEDINIDELNNIVNQYNINAIEVYDKSLSRKLFRLIFRNIFNTEYMNNLFGKQLIFTGFNDEYEIMEEYINE